MVAILEAALLCLLGFQNLTDLKESHAIRYFCPHSSCMWIVIVNVIAFTFQCGHNASLTTSEGGLANRITICLQCVLSAFTPVLSCGQALSDCNPITQDAI